MKKLKKKILLYSPILFGLVFIILAILARVMGTFDKGQEEYITASTLKDAVDISELSTAKFTYNGIAEIYDEKKSDKVKCYIKYRVKIKAGISDINQIDYKIDRDNKTIKIILPEMQITVDSVDPQSLSFMPENTTIDIKDILLACEKDAEEEVKDCPELMDVAEENMQSTVEALLVPLLKGTDYHIVD